MVKLFSDKDHKALEDAVCAAEKQTSAELAVVVARASDAYAAIALAFGVVLGCLVALVLWHEKVFIDFPRLMFVELVTSALMLLLPPLRHLSLILAPKRFMHRRAAQHAAEEYLTLTHKLPSAAPVVLLYISLAERYVHIYASRNVREVIPDEKWDAVVATLVKSVKADGVAKAVISAVEHAAGLLKAAYPDNGTKHAAANVLEIIT